MVLLALTDSQIMHDGVLSAGKTSTVHATQEEDEISRDQFTYKREHTALSLTCACEVSREQWERSPLSLNA